MRLLLRDRLRKALKGKNPRNSRSSMIKYLGCSISECKEHITRQFNQDMTWQNHGKLWEIDHRIPCASFDLTKESEIIKCFNYKNLQPLLNEQNRVKCANY